MSRAELTARLARLGVPSNYRTMSGQWMEVPTATLARVSDCFDDADPIDHAAPLVCTPGRHHPELYGTLILEDGFHFHCRGVVDVPGYHILYTDTGVRRFVIAAPERLRVPERGWGWQIQLYAARSRHSWGIGDFRDLGLICRLAAAQGASCVQISPVHAIAPVASPQPSPYSPTSRLFLNLLHVAPGAIPGAERVDLSDLDAAGRALNTERLIDRDRVWALKLAALNRVWAEVSTERDIEFRTWEIEGGQTLRNFAIWSAIAEHLGEADWQSWPQQFRRPDSPAVAEFAVEHAERVRFHIWAQWVAARQFGAACTCGVDVVADVAVGFDAMSADAWAFQDLVEFDFEIGAPPDDLNLDGQRWGLPPFSPQKLARSDFAAFIEVVHTALRHAGSLRLDHVMQLWRLYWVPVDAAAADGVFVSYPVDALLAILRVEALRANAWLVGEDMGTVPPGVRETMAEIGMLGTRSASRTAPNAFPALSVGTSSTHDQATVIGVLTGSDAAELRRIGKTTDWTILNRIRRGTAELAGIDPDRPACALTEYDLKAAVLARYRLLSNTDSVLVLVNVDDAALVAERPNMPGTVRGYPNWRLALPHPVDEVMSSDLASTLVKQLRADR